MENNSSVSNDSETAGLNRRRMLKVVGGTAVGLGITGLASGRVEQFSGCSEVCSDTDGDYAVVAVDGGYECRLMDQEPAQMDVSWDWATYCYQASDDEVIVGMLKEDVLVGENKSENGTCRLCTNPNDCASDHYGSVSSLVDALNESSSCDVCQGNVVADDECTSAGTGETSDGSSGDTSDGDSTDGGDATDDDDGADGGSSVDEGDPSESGEPADDSLPNAQEDSIESGQIGDGETANEDPTNDVDNTQETENSDGAEGDGAEDATDSSSDSAEDRLNSGGGNSPAREQDDANETEEETYDTPMERWFSRDTTPEEPPEPSPPSEDQDAAETVQSAMERWFDLDYTPDRPGSE